MTIRFWAFLILLLLAAPAHAEDWWWIGLNGQAPSRVVTYVDRDTMTAARSNTLTVWVLSIGESALPNGEQYRSTHYGLNCRARSYSVVGRIGYDATGNVIPLARVAPTPFEPVVAGSIGESILDFVCGRPDGTEVHVEEPVQHGIRYLSGQAQAGTSTPPAERERGSGMSLGTGFFIGSQGHVLTSHHVVEGADRIACRTQDGRIHDARVARISPANDLALLQVNLRPAHYLSFAPAGSLRPGDRVFTMGYPAPSVLGIQEPRFTDGTVSALSGPGFENAYMQISVPVQPGNSGGPLVNEAGQVVGVIAAQAAIEEFMRATGSLPQNINWAVKSEYATPLLAPLPAPTRHTREQAIELARNSICLIVAEATPE